MSLDYKFRFNNSKVSIIPHLKYAINAKQLRFSFLDTANLISRRKSPNRLAVKCFIEIHYLYDIWQQNME